MASVAAKRRWTTSWQHVLNSAAAPQVTLQLLLGALIAGALLLFPSYYYLFRIFKTQ